MGARTLPIGFALILTSLPLRASAQDGFIGVYADSNGAHDFATFTVGTPTTLYIIATLEGRTAGGIVGTEFRVVGLPDGWHTSHTPNPSAIISLGDPFYVPGRDWRANLTFSTCQVGLDDRILLYTVEVVPTSEVTNQSLTVATAAPPSNPTTETPLMILCDAPVYTPVAVEGRQLVINPVPRTVDYQVWSCHITFSDTSPSPGQAIDVQASISNLGDLDGEAPLPVRFQIDGTTLGSDVLVGPIPRRGAVRATSAVPWNADFDPHVITVIVNPDRSTPESDYENNSADCRTPYDLRPEPIPMFSDTNPCPGTSISILARITNDGGFDVDSVHVEFRETTSGVSVLERVAVQDLRARGVCPPRVFTQRLIPYEVESVGDHEIEIVVDPDNEIQEYDESNNSYAQTLHVTCTPSIWFDYEISSCDVGVSNTSPDAGEQIQFEATVHNVGALDAPGPTEVRFQLDGQPFGVDVPVAAIASMGSVTVSASLPWSADFDPHLLVATVNPDTLQIESRHDNNAATRVLPYDLYVTTSVSCGWPGHCSPCLGDTLAIEAFVHNNGAFDMGAVEVAFVDVLPDSQHLATLTVQDVPARTDCPPASAPSVSFAYPVDSVGINSLLVRADPEHVWPEFEENNNTIQMQFAVDCTRGPDLSIVSIEVYPSDSDLQPGSTLDSVVVVLHNQGREAASDVRARVTLDGQPLCPDLLVGDVPVGSMKAATCSTTWEVPEPPPFEHPLTACADPDNLVDEMNENNNCSTIDISGTQTPVTLTDLAASSTPRGVSLTWRVWDEFAQLGLDRRRGEGDPWERRTLFPSRRSGERRYREYSYLDTATLPGVRYDYRIVALNPESQGQVLGWISVAFTPPAPAELILHANTPNPFNPTTQIRLSLPRNQRVNVRILDSAGRLVFQLWDGTLEAGYRVLTWHGVDSQNLEVPSGVYFCDVLAEEGRRTQKLVLLK
ncbi:MAG: T9SS type A sorting domain-containing protein [Candidatus Latescibacterota bacterium]|nr:MAG: T9SS type A sorting domain-containing protein [Candidatus Latescibacterota bacterium]